MLNLESEEGFDAEQFSEDFEEIDASGDDEIG